VRLPEEVQDTLDALAQALAIIEGPDVATQLRVFAETVLNAAPTLEVSQSLAPGVRGATEALEILFQDEHLVAINKPSGLLVHRGWANDPAPALQLLRDQLGRRVHAVHRLDRATSGVLLFACSSEVARDAQALFEGGKVTKRYLAICRGNQLKTQRLAHPLAREKGGERLAAVTRFRLLGSFERYGLVEAIPETGRTHQIRRHLKHLSHPILGDVRYGKGEHNRLFRDRFNFLRLALHCESLVLPHPRTGDELRLTAPLPPDFSSLVMRFEGQVEQP
jgi:tRNA pseudouridine65 synthase